MYRGVSYIHNLLKMSLPHLTPTYERWAPFIARLIFGGAFLMSAFYKIPGSESYTMQVNMSDAAGLPFAGLLVTLAFVLELIAGICLIVGFHVRTAAAALAVFVLLIALTFYRDLSDMTQFPLFMSCLELIAGLIYVSVYGAQSVAVKTCQLPKGMMRG
jgi:putative oxidoreductase